MIKLMPFLQWLWHRVIHCTPQHVGATLHIDGVHYDTYRCETCGREYVEVYDRFINDGF